MNPTPFAVLLGLLAAAAAATALRRPALRRLAVRSAVRRPAETLLVVLGSMLGTAIITGSLVVGDTLASSIRSQAWTQLGPIDQTVTAFGSDRAADLRRALGGLETHPAVDGVLTAARGQATAAARLDGPDPAARANVLLLEMDFDEAREFGGDRSATGLGGTPTPRAGETVASRDLAEELGVGPGETVTVFAYGAEETLRVAGVLPRVGLAGYATSGSRSYSLFVAPGTVERLAATPSEVALAPPLSLAFVSNTGGVIAGAAHTATVVPLIEERIAGVPGAEVRATKQDLLEIADDAGGQFTTLFLTIGGFAIVAGVLLLVNLIVMLGEERKAELGMMRAVGMRRGQLVGALFIEGSLYALTSAALGAAAGIGVGAAIVAVAAGIFAGFGDFAVDLRLTVAGASVAGGFLAGALIAMGTVLATGIRISRLNVIRAIRDLPEPGAAAPGAGRLILAGLAAVAGAAITAASYAADDPFGLLAGPALAAFGASALLNRFVPRRLVVTVAGCAVLGWAMTAMRILPDPFRDVDVPIFLLQGLLLTFAGVAVLGANQDAAGRALRRLATGPRGLVARLGLAYPIARRFRTSMTLTMYALVVFTLTFIAILAGVFGGQVERFTAQEAGGADLLVRSGAADPVPVEETAAVPGVGAAAAVRYAPFTVEFRPERRDDFTAWAATGIDERYLALGPPSLARWHPDYPSEEAVWRALVADPETMVVDGFFLQTGGGPPGEPARLGDLVEVRDPLTGTVATRRVIGRLHGGVSFPGAFLAAGSLQEVVGERAAPSRIVVAAAPGVEPEALAAALRAALVRYGARVDTFEQLVAESQATNLQFFRLMQGYLALGLVIGISGLGVIMVRAVRERRRQVGVLRAVGVQAATVRRAFLLESGFVSLQGILLGAGLAIATAHQLITNAEVFGDADVAFSVPWGELTLLLGVTFAASLAATAWPARAASGIPPAVALRLSD